MAIKTTVYAASVAPLADETLYAKAYNIVTDKRKEKADRYKFSKDRRLCLGAEILLREAMERQGYGKAPLELSEGLYGKPFLTKTPEFRFNLSHSGDWVLCAVSDRDVGCDIEEMTHVSLKMAERFFYQEEYQKILSCSGETEQREMFFRLWTLKESFMKMKGLGMYLAPDTFGIRMEQLKIFALQQGREPDACCFREFDSIPGYRAALCVENDGGEVPLETVDLRECLTGK